MVGRRDVLPDRGIDPPRERRNGGVLEQLAQRDLDPKAAADLGEDARGEQRMPAEIEEVVVHPDGGETKDFAPDAGDLCLCGRPGSRRIVLALLLGGRREAGVVHLSIEVHRYRPKINEARRNHVFRQRGAQEAAQLRRIWLA